MRNFTYFIAIILFGITLCGCTKTLTITTSSFEVPEEGGNVKVELKTNTEFRVTIAEDSRSWITQVEPRGLETHILSFNISVNQEPDIRVGTIIIRNTNGDISENITINQAGKSFGYYVSTDYSKDGEVLILQTASDDGIGINIVIVGDGFTDKDMGTGGKYEQRMREAMEHFFSEEPYKTFRNRYNVYSVKAVSKNEIYTEHSRTIFECKFGEGTLISGNDNKVFEYVSKLSSIESLDDLTIITILNSPKYAGTCYMYTNNASIAYCPIVDYKDEPYRQIIIHEAAGHGFAKLADEYFDSGYITTETISEYQKLKKIDWQANADIANDPNTIRWAHLLSDSRYTSEVSIFEGALGYTYGAYRPTDYSIMRSNTGGFNAPSREAIFKRIITLSGGTYYYEDFVTYDTRNRTSSAITARRAQASQVDQTTFIPLAPPVIIWDSPSSQ